MCRRCLDTRRAKVAARKAHGACRRCGVSPPEPGHTACRACLDLASGYAAQRRGSGKCAMCAAMAEPGSSRCKDCYVKSNADQKVHRRRHSARAKKLGMCGKCTRPCIDGLRICEHHWFHVASASALGSCRHSADLRAKLNAQAGRCHYTGVELRPGNASVDHLLPVSRYPLLRSEPSNVVWCAKHINSMKGVLTDSEFIDLCHAVAKAHPGVATGRAARVKAIMELSLPWGRRRLKRPRGKA